MRLLLVDDDRFTLKTLGERLRQAAHEVVAVESAAAALEQNLNSFDGIICDYVMPQMNGAELLRRIRKERRCDTPFVFITATRQPQELVQEAIRYDADFLPKPVEPKKLIELLLERRARAR